MGKGTGAGLWDQEVYPTTSVIQGNALFKEGGVSLWRSFCCITEVVTGSLPTALNPEQEEFEKMWKEEGAKRARDAEAKKREDEAEAAHREEQAREEAAGEDFLSANHRVALRVCLCLCVSVSLGLCAWGFHMCTFRTRRESAFSFKDEWNSSRKPMCFASSLKRVCVEVRGPIRMAVFSFLVSS